MSAQGRIACAGHDRAQKHRFKVTAVIGEMPMRLSKGRHDLRHLKAVFTVFICQCCAVAVRVTFMLFGGMCPDLNGCPAKGYPSPARRTVPVIQNPPPPIRSTMGAPGK